MIPITLSESATCVRRRFPTAMWRVCAPVVRFALTVTRTESARFVNLLAPIAGVMACAAFAKVVVSIAGQRGLARFVEAFALTTGLKGRAPSAASVVHMNGQRVSVVSAVLHVPIPTKIIFVPIADL